MNAVIVYGSRHGCSDKIATMLQHGLGSATLVHLEEETKLDLAPYDTVIVGGPIYGGSMEGRVRRFCRRNLDVLLQKRLGLFICCMEVGERTDEELHEAFPPDLLSHAAAKGIFGDQLASGQSDIAERFLTRSIAKVEHNISSLSQERIARFLEQLQAG